MRTLAKLLAVATAIVAVAFFAFTYRNEGDIYYCGSSYAIINSDQDAILAAKKFVEEKHNFNIREYRDVIQSMDYSSGEIRGLKNNVGWEVSHFVQDYYPFRDIINVDFAGRDGSSMSCKMLKCGKVLECEEYQ